MNKKLMWWNIGLYSFIFVVTGYVSIIKWSMYQNFSPEVNAAIITALVTVPIGVFTVLGTVWITVVSIRKTVETAIMQQRTGVRDQLLSNRIEVYKELFKQTLIYKHKKFGSGNVQIEIHEDYTKWLHRFYLDNSIYLSDNIRFLINSFLDTSLFKPGGNFKSYNSYKDIVESQIIYREIKQKIEDMGLLEMTEGENPRVLYNEILFGFVNIEVVNIIPVKWYKKVLNKNFKLPDVRKEIILKRYVGFLYESRGSKDKEILSTENNMFHLQYFEAMNSHLNYFITSELDFKYIKNDIDSLYYK